MGDYDDDEGYALYPENSQPWWHKRDGRQRVKQMVAQAVSNELERNRLLRADSEVRFKASWDRTNRLFDPPPDHRSMSERLGLPYTRIEEPSDLSMAVDEEQDDGPPPPTTGEGS